MGANDWSAHGDFALPTYVNHIAVFAWALSGAIIGVRRGYDIVGVFVIALVSSMGGGLIRDGLLLQRVPALLTGDAPLLLILVATGLVGVASRWIVARNLATFEKLIEVTDAVGVPAYAILGMQMAAEQDVSTLGVVLVGVINGVGGGLLRDLLARETPHLLKPGQYSALIALLACVSFVALTRAFDVDPTHAAFATMALYFIARALTIRFHWTTRSLSPEHAV